MRLGNSCAEIAILEEVCVVIPRKSKRRIDPGIGIREFQRELLDFGSG